MAAKNRRAFELTLGKLGLILFIGGISLLLFSIFLLGIVVGKHMEAYPERYSAGMAEMVYDRLFVSKPQGGRVSPSAESGAKSEPAGGEEGFGLTFYDTLAGKKEGTPTGKTTGAVKDMPPGSSVPPPALTEKPAMPAPSAPSAGGAVGNTDLPIPGRDGKKTSSPEKKAAVESGPRVSTATPATPAAPVGTARDGGATPEKGRFEVQVAAYQESRKAEQMMEKLTPLGFTSRVVLKELPSKGKWFRVIVGSFENREKAKAAADQIAGKIRGVKCVVRSSGKNGGN
jgi:cell division septation protein DedD